MIYLYYYSCFKILGKKNVNIEVTGDKYCPWNNGIWNIIATDNQVNCKRARDEIKPDFKGTITDWTKVLLGRFSLEQAVKLNLIEQIGS